MSYGRQAGYGPPLGATVPKATYDAIIAPTVNEDAGDGYKIGSRWIDTVLKHEHVLVDSSAGAAVWKPTTYCTAAGLPDPFAIPDGFWQVSGGVDITIATAGIALETITTTDLTNQSIVSTEDNVVRTAAMWQATRAALATGPVIDITPGGATAAILTRGGKIDYSVAGDLKEYVYSSAASTIGMATDGIVRWSFSGATLTHEMAAIGAVTVDAGLGHLLVNASGAADGAQQFSPLFLLEGQGFDDTVAQTTREVRMGFQVQPVQVTGAICTGNLAVISSINGAGYVQQWQFTSGGNLQALTLGNALVLSPSDLGEQIKSPVDDQISIYLDVTTEAFRFTKTLNTSLLDFHPSGSGAKVCGAPGSEWLSMAARSLLLEEQAAAQSNTAAYGQYWVKTATPNYPMFSDDAATDFRIVTDTFTQLKINAAVTPDEILTLIGAAHGDATPIAASVSATDILFDLDRTITYATGALAEHSAIIIDAPVLAFAGASTVAKAYTVKISGPPTAGANCTLAASDAFALYSAGQIGLASGVGLFFDANQASPNDYIVAPSAGVIRIYGSGSLVAQFGVGADFELNPAPAYGLQLTQTKYNAVATPGELLTLTGATHGDATPIAASVSATDVLLDFDRTITYATGALAAHTTISITAPELAFAGASTVAKAYTVHISGAPTAGANCTLAASDTFALYSGGNVGMLSTTRLYFDADVASPGAMIYAPSANRLDIVAGSSLLGGFSYSAGILLTPVNNTGVEITQAARAGSVPAEILTVTGAAHTTMTASTEATSMLFDFGQTMQWATGALASNATIKIKAPTLAFVGASTVAKAYTVHIDGAPTAGANCTLAAEDAFALYCGGHVGVPIGTRMYFDADESSPNDFITATANSKVDIYSAGVIKLSVGGVTETVFTPHAGYGVTLTQAKINAASTPGELLTLTGATHGDATPIAAGVEALDVLLDFDRTVTFATGALGNQACVRLTPPTYAFAGASVITTASTVEITNAPQEGALCTITNPYALNVLAGATRLAGLLYADAGVKATAGYCIEGASTTRQVMRSALLTITGTADATTVTLEQSNEWNGEALAVETVDSDTPTGGTRFDISADGLTITIKGLSQTALAAPSHHLHSTDVGTNWHVHVAEASGNLEVECTNAQTGVAIDFTAAALNGKVIIVNFLYLTST
jgi:hypothetical protein